MRIRELRFRWRPDGPAVLGLARLEIGRGERVFIAGPSGSGKTTLLSLLAGVATSAEGELSVLGRRLADMTQAQRDHFRADHLGYIFQMFNLLPYLSLLENVTLPCRFSRLRRARAAANGGLESEAMRLLEHLDMGEAARAGRPVGELSVGQQQRVAAARALMGAPDLLIADEPTSALDSDRREAFLRLLFRECAATGMTLVFVSHDTSLQPLFDRAIRLAAPDVLASAADPADPEPSGGDRWG